MMAVHAKLQVGASPAYPLPAYARRVMGALEAHGYEAWAVGGWVRDALIDAPSHDVDVCTDALWPETRACCEAAGLTVHETGTHHGTVTVVSEGQPVEVTTYRVERGYSDHRHPDEVVFVRDLVDDLGRRDFTVNAMAYHPERGVFDPYGGREDLARGVIRAVGDPSARFAEDALRVLRAVRFAARLGFEVERVTAQALEQAAPGLADISYERIGAELDGILATGRMGWALLAHPDVLCAAIPELAPARGFCQRSIYHAYDVYEHIARVTWALEAYCGGYARPALRWAALLHDVAKPHTLTVDDEGRGHFYGHPEEGARMAGTIMRRLAQPSDDIRTAAALIRMHDHVMEPTVRNVRRTLARCEAAVPGDGARLFFDLLQLRKADATAKQPRYARFAVWLDQVEELLRAELRDRPCYRLRDLAVGGGDLIDACGMEPGPAIGQTLKWLLDQVMRGALPNDRDALVAAVRSR
jgi:tRNA nucleotidyltransferase (CCA-adding enzyme)